MLLTLIICFTISLNINSQDLDSIVEKKSNTPLKEFKQNIDTSFIEKKSFDSTKLEEFKNSDDFVYEVKEEEPGIFQRFWNWIKLTVRNFLNYLFDDIDPAVGLLRNILRIIPYIILAVGLFFIIKYFTNVKSRALLEGKNNQIAQFADDEELLEREDLETLLSDSVNNHDYRSAIRFYYLIILKKLRDLEIIDWQQQKTNKDYIQELSKKSYQEDFINTTNLYDFVWYGKFKIEEEEFLKASKNFQKLKNKIA